MAEKLIEMNNFPFSFVIREFIHKSWRWLLITWRFHLILAVAVVIGCLFLACHANSSEYFSRSGSIVSLIGGFMTFRQYLRGTWNFHRRITGEADQPPFARTHNPLVAREKAQQGDSDVTKWGIAVRFPTP
jgi:hypothetical protein